MRSSAASLYSSGAERTGAIVRRRASSLRAARARITRAARARAGVTVVEVIVVLAILTVAMDMFAQTLASSVRLDPMSSETSIAAEAARVQIEQMHNQPFSDLFALYNTNPGDDPGGPGTAPGHQFGVPGLATFGAEGLVGHIQFPSTDDALREDVDDPMLGMPRDLNGDGLIDTRNHAGDRIILPVRIRIQWATRIGRSNRRSLEFYTMFADL